MHGTSGADGGCIFKHRTSSTTIIGVRRYDVDPSKSGKSYVWQIWIVYFPGGVNRAARCKTIHIHHY